MPASFQLFRSKTVLVAPLLCCLLLGGCKSASTLPEGGHLSPLEYFAWLHSAPPATIAAESMRLHSYSAELEDLRHAVWLALLLLAAPEEHAMDEAEVLTRLDAVATTNTEAGRYPEFALFAAMLREHFTLRKRVRGSDTDNALLRAEITTLKADKSRLQQMIDELTSIEQQLIERELQQERAR